MATAAARDLPELRDSSPLGAAAPGVTVASSWRVRRSRGFTLVELMVTVAIIAIVAALAYFGVARLRPRAELLTSAADLEALVRGARQNALSTGRDTVVMVFPQARNPRGGAGRVIVYEDAAHTFFGAVAPNFDAFDPVAPGVPGDSLLGNLDLPLGITFGLGGAAAPVLDDPYKSIPVGLCSFCASTGDDRGAIAFDYRGRARFYPSCGAPLAVPGGTLALQGNQDLRGSFRLLVITTATGGVRSLSGG